VLDISKIESGRLELRRESFDFGQCIEEVLAGIRHHAASKSIVIENKSGFQGPLYADRLRVKEIFYNLLNNAVKFTPPGGRVCVESAREDGFLVASVSDTGIGISEKEHAAIFEKFYQAGDPRENMREGTGLGLPITRHLVELHGGSISLESRPGQGSTFKVTFPLTQPSGD
jgi:signal transduction histidine kinase